MQHSPEDRGESNSAGDKAGQQPRETGDETFILRPFWFVQAFPAHAKRYYLEKETRPCYHESVRRWPVGACKAIQDYYSRMLRGFTANAVIAAFTVVLSIATIIQAFKTTEIVTQMRLEKRAWIAVGAATVVSFGEDSRFEIHLENTGLVPADITIFAVKPIVYSKQRDIADDADAYMDIESAKDTSRRQLVIAPGGRTNQPANMPSLEADFISAIENDKADLFLLIRVIYQDTIGSSGETQQCFRYKRGDGPGQGTFVINHQCNYMK